VSLDQIGGRWRFCPERFQAMHSNCCCGLRFALVGPNSDKEQYLTTNGLVLAILANFTSDCGLRKAAPDLKLRRGVQARRPMQSEAYQPLSGKRFGRGSS
jgi:hypothetical protein